MYFLASNSRLLSELLLLAVVLSLCITATLQEHSSSSPSSSSSSSHYTKTHQFTTDCGIRPIRREPRARQQELRQPSRSRKSNATSQTGSQAGSQRTARIIAGTMTRDGQFPWQASLELLHPSMGFLGHWCGAVLIHRYWVLSAAHCVHNDLFNLPLPPLWTVVLGEHNRFVESGYELRIPVEKIVLHKHYHNFLNDLVLMKLSTPADLSHRSNVRRICLPFVFNTAPTNNHEHNAATAEYHDGQEEDAEEEEEDVDDPLESGLAEVPDKMDNFLRSVHSIRRRANVTLPSMKELMSTKILNRLKQAESQRAGRALPLMKGRRNDKLMKVHVNAYEYEGLLGQQQQHQHHLPSHVDDFQDLPYVDCMATGWGKSNMTGDLTSLLLKTRVPLHNNGRCKEAYGSFVNIHHGHLCAGKLNGKGGTCVGDSGGPLQCRLTKNGPWILAGITSFGSGCAIAGFPDVYTRTSYYMKWIQDTIAYE